MVCRECATSGTLNNELEDLAENRNPSDEHLNTVEQRVNHRSFTPSTRKLIRGQSEQSRLIVAWPHLHVFVWLPSWGSHSLGVTLRTKRDDGWTHYRLVVMQHNNFNMGQWRQKSPNRTGRFYVRRSLTLLEASRWRTAPGTKDRVGLKSYFRIKVSPGGREG